MFFLCCNSISPLTPPRFPHYTSMVTLSHPASYFSFISAAISPLPMFFLCHDSILPLPPPRFPHGTALGHAPHPCIGPGAISARIPRTHKPITPTPPTHTSHTPLSCPPPPPPLAAASPQSSVSPSCLSYRRPSRVICGRISRIPGQLLQHLGSVEVSAICLFIFGFRKCRWKRRRGYAWVGLGVGGCPYATVTGCG